MIRKGRDNKKIRIIIKIRIVIKYRSFNYYMDHTLTAAAAAAGHLSLCGLTAASRLCWADLHRDGALLSLHGDNIRV